MPDIATESWHLSILRAHQQDSVIPVLRQDVDGVLHLLLRGRLVHGAFVVKVHCSTSEQIVDENTKRVMVRSVC